MGCGASTPAVNDGEAPLQVPPEPPKGKASGPPKRRASYQSPEVTVPDVAGPGNVNPLPSNLVGTYSNHGIKPGPYGKPAAKINQDRGFITYPLSGDKSMCLMAVYDGHGANGEMISEFVMIKVPDLLEENPEQLRTDPVAAGLKWIILADCSKTAQTALTSAFPLHKPFQRMKWVLRWHAHWANEMSFV